MKKNLALILVLALLVSLLAGCANGNTPAAPAAPTATDAAPAPGAADAPAENTPAGDPIKIGAIAPVTGDRAEVGKSVWLSWQIAIRDINAAGGVLGRPVELVLEDSKGDPKEAVELAKKLADNNEICAVLGPMMSSEAIACSPVFDEYGIVEMAPVASNSQYAPMSPWSFTLAGKQSAEMPYFAEHILKNFAKASSVGIIYVNDDWGVSSIESLTKACDKYGIQIATMESYATGEKDFTAMLTKIRQTNPDALVLVTQAPEGSLILNQIANMAWDVQLIGTGAMYSDQVIQLAGATSEGLIAPSAFFLLEDDIPAFEYATVFESEAGFKPTIHGPLSYDSAVVLCAAIESAGSVDRTAIRDALQATKDVKGLAGTYEFTKDGDIIRQYRVLQVENGAWVARTEYAQSEDAQ